MTAHRIYVLGSSTPTQITPPGVHSGMDITIQAADNFHIAGTFEIEP